MICKILAALDNSDCGRSAGKYAAYLGAELNAGVEALTVVDIRPLEGPILRDFTAHLGLEPFETYTQALRDVLQQRADDVLELFRQDAAAQSLDPERVSAGSELGIVAETICRRANSADLVVIGQFGESPAASGGLLGSTSEQVVRRTNRPVIVCPPMFRPITKALVAYDATPKAEDALHVAADFAAQLGIALTVLVVQDGEQVDEERATRIREQAERYLSNAHLRAEFSVVEGNPEEVIIDSADKGDHDLVAMGAFGHGRIRQLFVGSVTAHVMRSSKVPVLLSR
ncbi:MAG TPA: universal stress protein [Firmicutes bacterium]|nr:universal stress protein [Bacillota bacterium]